MSPARPSLGGDDVVPTYSCESIEERLLTPPSLGGDGSTIQHIEIEKSEDAVKLTTNDEPTPVTDVYEGPESNQKNESGPEKHTVTATGELKIEAILQKYEQEILQLQRELGVLRNTYIDKSINLHHCDTKQTDAEEYESTNHLVQLMENLEKRTRGKTPKLQRPNRQASQARLKLWDATLGRRDTIELLTAVESELRQLETVVPILRAGQLQEPKTSMVKRKINPYAITEIDTPSGYEELEPLGENSLRIWVEPQLEAEEFFLVKNITTPKYHATTMILRLEDADNRSTTLKAVIDSGAAWSAIDEHTLLTNFPSIKLLPSDRKFKDASGNVMKVVGRVALNFFLGDLTLATIVYVFKGLGAAFLLGVNSLHTHQLGLSTQRRVLFSEHPLASRDSQATVEFAHLDDNCIECQTEDSTHNCHCAIRNNMIMTCEVTNSLCTMTVTTPTLGTTTIPVIMETNDSTENLINMHQELPYERRLRCHSTCQRHSVYK